MTVGVLAAALLGCWASTAAADEPVATAIVVKPGGQSMVGPVSLSTLEETPACVPYATNPGSTLTNVGPDAGSPVVATRSYSWTLYTILQCGLGQTLSAGDWVQVESPANGPEGPLFYSSGDLTTPSDFQDPTQVPLIIAEPDANLLQYYRPQRQLDDGATDENAYDAIEDNSGPLTIWVDESSSAPLSLAIAEVPAGGVAAGGSVSLSASLQPAGAATPDPANLSYAWTTPDGDVQFSNGGAGATVEATFAAAGDYPVTVEAQDSQAGTLGFATVKISVGGGSDAASGSPSASNGQTSQPSAPASGPKQSSGVTVGGSAGTTHLSAPGGSATSGGTGRGATATAKPKPAAKPTATHRGGSTATQTAPRHVATANSRSSVSPGTHAPTSTSYRAHHRSRPATPSTTPLPTSPALATATPNEPRIAGRLIGSVTPLPAAASPLVHAVPAATATAAPVRRGVSASAIPALAGGLVVILLFSLGVARELRGRRGLGARVLRS
jgi:hypothetical protein